jgi:Flp pilus assembly protein TadB
MAEMRSGVRAGRRSARVLAAVCALGCSGLAGVTPSTAKNAAQSTTSSATVSKVGSAQGWLGDGTTWPQRALVLFAPHGSAVSAATVHVTEDGAPAGGLSVTPLNQARPRDFGVMVVAGTSTSMTGAPLSAVMGAVRSIAAARSAGQMLGVIAFASRPLVFLPLTSDPATIGHVLAAAPPAGNGADVPSAIKLGLAQLSAAKLALGAIIVVSDGVGNLTGSGITTPEAVKATAAAANAPVFTIGLQDHAATAASLRSLAGVAPGQFVATPSARLAAVFKAIYATVTRGYVVRWRSAARPGRTVNVAATVTGAAGGIQASYQLPATPTPAAPAKAPARAAGATHRLTAADISLRNKLARLPFFAVLAPTLPPATAAAPSSFWNTPHGVLAAAAIAGLLLALALAMVFYRPSNRAVRARVGSFIPGIVEVEPGEGLVAAPRRGGLMRRFERGTWWPPFVENVEISGSPHSPVALVKRSAALGMVVAVVMTVISGSVLIALIPLLLWPFALRKAMARSAGKQREKFRDTLPGYLQDLASAMRVGRSFVGGLSAVVETADEPIRGAFERAITDEALGRPLEEALEAAAKRMQASDLDQVALIAGLNRRSGSNVAEALDRVAEGARERADLRREIKALTGQARMSSWVLTALPGVLLVGITVVSPLYAHPLLHTPLGIVLLFVGAAMVFAGWKVMKKITDVEP